MKKLFSLFACILMLSGCAEMELASHVAKKGVTPTQGTFKVGNPYEVKGKTYRPSETYELAESGVASWYGPNFHGKRTANGETFDMNAMTAAHKTLQMPSIIRVTNLENGRSAIMRVNDRGPFSKKRVLDVSKRGAEVLGFKNQGTTRVKIEVMKDASRQVAALAKQGRSTTGFETALNQQRTIPAAVPREPISRVASLQSAPQGLAPPPVTQTALARAQPVTPVEGVQLASLNPNDMALSSDPARPLTAYPGAGAAKNIYVQAAAFQDRTAAQAMVRNLASYGRAHIQSALVNGREWHRVRFGPMSNEQNAALLSSKLEYAAHTKPIVVID